MEESLQAASPEWKEGVRVFPADVRSSVGHEVVEEGVGRWRTEAEVDRKTGQLDGFSYVQ